MYTVLAVPHMFLHLLLVLAYGFVWVILGALVKVFRTSPDVSQIAMASQLKVHMRSRPRAWRKGIKTSGFFLTFSEWPLAVWPACRPATVASWAHLPPAKGRMAIHSPGQKTLRALRARITRTLRAQ